MAASGFRSHRMPFILSSDYLILRASLAINDQKRIRLSTTKYKQKDYQLMATELLAGISQNRIKTDRLEVAYLEAGEGGTPVVLIHGNTASSLFYQDFMLALAATGRYKIYAPDMRGFGDTEVLPIDATRGVRDFSDDLYLLTRALGLSSFHLFGWSLGANVVMQFATYHPNALHSLTLEAPLSPIC